MSALGKTDRAAMLDEILDSVKFLRLQVKVLSMSRLGGAGAVAQLVADIPLSVKGEASESGSTQHIWEKWSTDGTEKQVAKLMEEDIGAAMQFLVCWFCYDGWATVNELVDLLGPQWIIKIGKTLAGPSCLLHRPSQFGAF